MIMAKRGESRLNFVLSEKAQKAFFFATLFRYGARITNVKRSLSHSVKFKKPISSSNGQSLARGWISNPILPPASGCLSLSLGVTKKFPSASCLLDCFSAYVSRKETFLNLSS
jgi:hypothetical protein